MIGLAVRCMLYMLMCCAIVYELKNPSSHTHTCTLRERDRQREREREREREIAEYIRLTRSNGEGRTTALARSNTTFSEQA